MKEKAKILALIREEYDKLLYEEEEAVKKIKEEVMELTVKMLVEMNSNN